MWRNPFQQLNRRDWLFLSVSLAVVISCIVLTPTASIVTRMAVLVGVVSLIFLAKGDVWGQALMVVFSILYGITSWQFRYYGEMITYLGMTLPMAVLGLVSWLRHPFDGNAAQVEIHRLTGCQKIVMVVGAVAVTGLLGWVLYWLHTPNLLFSVLSITTSFVAAYLTYCRSSYYALAYAANDVILIVLWVLASVKDKSFTPMIACFLVFFANDLYGFFSWKRREKEQQAMSGNR